MPGVGLERIINKVILVGIGAFVLAIILTAIFTPIIDNYTVSVVVLLLLGVFIISIAIGLFHVIAKTMALPAKIRNKISIPILWFGGVLLLEIAKRYSVHFSLGLLLIFFIALIVGTFYLDREFVKDTITKFGESSSNKDEPINYSDATSQTEKWLWGGGGYKTTIANKQVQYGDLVIHQKKLKKTLNDNMKVPRSSMLDWPNGGNRKSNNLSYLD